MQIINYYLRADSIKATAVDKWNQPLSSIPTLTRGMHATLVLNLLDADGEPISASDLAQYTTWDFAIAHDWNTTTLPQIRVVSGIEQVNNTICIPLLETNTETLIKALGTNEQVNFGCELAGFEPGSDTPSYLLQFNIIIRNRRCDAGTGIPTQVDDGMYTAAQVRALMSASMEVQVSADGTSWHTTQELPNGARYFRFRNEAIAGEWSEPLPIIIGDVPLIDAYTKTETDSLLKNKLSASKNEDLNITTIEDNIEFGGCNIFNSQTLFNSNLSISKNGILEVAGEAHFMNEGCTSFSGQVGFHGTTIFSGATILGSDSHLDVLGNSNFSGCVKFEAGVSFSSCSGITPSGLYLACDSYIQNFGRLEQWGNSEFYGSIFFYNSLQFCGSSGTLINLGNNTIMIGCTNLTEWMRSVNQKLESL